MKQGYVDKILKAKSNLTYLVNLNGRTNNLVVPHF